MIIIMILYDFLYSNENKYVHLGGWKNEEDLGRVGKLINILYEKIHFQLKKDKAVGSPVGLFLN